MSGNSSRTTALVWAVESIKEITPVVSDGGDPGSPGWIRTNNQVINSHLLCQLSYRGNELTSGRKRYRAATKLSTMSADPVDPVTGSGRIQY